MLRTAVFVSLYVPNSCLNPPPQMNEKWFVPPLIVDENSCTECLNCMLSCPDMAIVVTVKNKKKASK